MFLWYESRGREVARGTWAFVPSIVNMSCADRPCFSCSDKCLFCWAAFFPSAYWQMHEMSRPFVHGHTLLYSWSGPMKLVVCLLHGATLLSNFTIAPFVPGQGLGHQNNTLSPLPKPLSTADLVRTTCKLPKHNPSASEKSRDVFGTGDFTTT